METLSAQEVAAHFRRAIRAEITIAAEGPIPYKGEMRYVVGDGRVRVVYYDGRLDYCDRVSAPDGRAGEYADWADDKGNGNLISLLSTDEALALEEIFNRARQSDDAAWGTDKVSAHASHPASPITSSYCNQSRWLP